MEKKSRIDYGFLTLKPLLKHCLFLVFICLILQPNLIFAKSLNGEVNSANSAIKNFPPLLQALQLDEKNIDLNAKILQYNLPFLQNIDPEKQNLSRGFCALTSADLLLNLSLSTIYSQGYGTKKDQSLSNMFIGILLASSFKNSERECQNPQIQMETNFWWPFITLNNKSQTLQWLEISAWHGEKDAQLFLAEFYSKSNDVDDLKQAYNWWLMLANKGNKDAIYQLGQFYQDGRVVNQDFKRTFYYYQKSAELGNLQAISKLGTFYAHGLFVTKDLKTAFELYLKAAHLGDAESQLYLSKAYFYGEGVKENKDEALKWLIKSASLNHQGTQCWFGEAFLDNRLPKNKNISAYMFCYMAKLRDYTLNQPSQNQKIENNVAAIAKTMSADEVKKAQERAKACLDGNMRGCPEGILPNNVGFMLTSFIQIFANAVDRSDR